jgi:hypothetical protein
MPQRELRVGRVEWRDREQVGVERFRAVRLLVDQPAEQRETDHQTKHQQGERPALEQSLSRLDRQLGNSLHGAG